MSNIKFEKFECISIGHHFNFEIDHIEMESIIDYDDDYSDLESEFYGVYVDDILIFRFRIRFDQIKIMKNRLNLSIERDFDLLIDEIHNHQ